MINSFLQAVRKVRCRASSHPAKDYPAMRSHFFVNEEKKFIYVYVPKVASGSLAAWFLAAQGVANMKRGMHTYASRHFALGKYGPAEAERLLKNCFKFAFVRNPWSRLCSCYVSIFIRGANRGNSPIFSGLARDVSQRLAEMNGGQADNGAALTFREFVGYVYAEKEDERLDVHWRPQSWFIRPDQLDFIGRFETLAADLGTIQEKVGVSAELPHYHKNPFVEVEEQKCLSDTPANELTELKSFPEYHHFYTDDLRELVGERYRADVEAFNYTFD